MSSESFRQQRGFQLVCYAATSLSTETADERIDPGQRLAHLRGGEGWGAMICKVMEACKSGLLVQGLLRCDLLLNTAAGK